MNLPENTSDPFEILSSFMKIGQKWMQDMPGFAERITELGKSLWDTGSEDLRTYFSDETHSKKIPRDEKAVLSEFVRQYSVSARKSHQVFGQWLKQMIAQTPDLDCKERERSLFWANQFINAIAPSNYFWTNPGAVQRFMDSKGESLKKGFDNWQKDAERGDNMIGLVNETAFRLGENLATTPGYVIFRNELIELIRYTPLTETVYDVPIVLIQPWINKYYIFDLSPANSFVRYLIQEGFTVFITSWKNPTSDMRHISFEDYMFKGALTAIRVAADICGTNQVHAAGYCIGGTILAALMAWLNHEDEKNIPVADWTMFASLLDFSDPGELSVFMGEKSIEAIESLMEKDGFLDRHYIGLGFRLLNPENLIWRYLVNNYLYGELPPKSDMLYWNSDSTRLPAAMCSYYLKECYLKNNLIRKNAVILGNRPIDLSSIRQPLYAVAAQQDHISPWTGTFRSCFPMQCPIRYVLATEGHITGIVNPPSKWSKKKYRAGEIGADTDPETWASEQTDHKGSWWTDWVQWLIPNSRGRAVPPAMGSDDYPQITAAPGTYVFEK